MGTRGATTGTRSPRLRLAVVVTGLAGGAWGVAAALGALEMTGRGPLQPVDGRVGELAGLAALGLAALALAGALVVIRVPALSCALLFLASIGGFLAVGAAWLGPGAVQLVSSLLALVAIENPFAERVSPGREGRARAHDRPG